VPYITKVFESNALYSHSNIDIKLFVLCRTLQKCLRVTRSIRTVISISNSLFCAVHYKSVWQ